MKILLKIIETTTNFYPIKIQIHKRKKTYNFDYIFASEQQTIKIVYYLYI